MNPMALLKIKQRLETFQKDHPKFLPFVTAVRDQALEEGSIIDIKVTTPDGKVLNSNIKVTANDIETVRSLFEQPTS